MDRVPERVGWVGKFANAFRGIWVGVRGQNSFAVHLPVAILVIGGAMYFQVDATKVCVILLCIAIVFSCELLNSAIEKMAKAVTDEYNENIRDALDIASGAVLTASAFSVLTGVIVFFVGLY